ncbi:MAG: hypothetical protein MUO35_03805 [Anaerolineales bacterium]|nr:hypothetical protein [Anaerolineales bacterium]
MLYPLAYKSASVNAGVSGAYGSYTNLVAKASNTIPFILCGLYAQIAYSLTTEGTQSGLMNFQVAIGDSPDEVPIAEGHDSMILAPGYISGTAQSVTGLKAGTIFVEPVLIPAGTRIVYRAASNLAVAVLTSAYAFGYDARYFAQPLRVVDELRYMRGLCSPTKGATVWPAIGGTAVTSHATPYAYGTWVPFIDPATSPLEVTGLIALQITSNTSGQFNIGIGAPGGGEIAMSRCGTPSRIGHFLYGDCYLPRPLYVKTGESVSVQAATGASGGITIALVAIRANVLK